MKPIKAVIIGFAHMHVNEIALYLSEQPDTELAGCTDIPLELEEQTQGRYTRAWNRRNVCETYQVPYFATVEELLDTVKPDIAYILTDNAGKPAAVEQCACRGVDVCIEKPMAASLSEALRIRKIVQETGIEAVVNWPTTWRPTGHQLKQALELETAGPLLKLSYLNGHTGPLGTGARHRGVSAAAEEMTPEQRAHTWWYNARYGGGAFLDIGCYGCMYSRWFQPEPACGVQALAMNLGTPEADCPDNVALLIRYPHAMTTAEGTWTVPQAAIPGGPTAFCRDGVIFYVRENGGLRLRAVDRLGNPLEIPVLELPDRFRNMAWHYAAHRMEGTPFHPTVTLEQNVQVLALLDAAMASARSGREEPVESVLP